MARKFGGVGGRKDNNSAKTYRHLDKSATGISKTVAATRTTSSLLTSGSINYNLSLGENFISFPFANPSTIYDGNGEPDGIDTYGYWTPEEIDAEFDNNIYQIIGAGVACSKVDQRPGTSGSFVGSLNKFWPKQAYWVKVTGSSTLNKTVTKQLIDANYETKFDGGWKWMAYPFSEYTDISPSGYVPAGNNHNMIAWRIRNGSIVNQLMGESDAAVYIGDAGFGTWQGSFTFKTGSGFMVYNHTSVQMVENAFNLISTTGSDSGEGNDDSDSDNYYTGSSDVCFGSASSYIETPISNGNFIHGEGAGTFQTYQSIDSYHILINSKFTGSGLIMSTSILNHDNTQMVTPEYWATATGSIAVGLFNLSGSNAGGQIGTGGWPSYSSSGSVDDNSVCFASNPWPSHPECVPPNYDRPFHLQAKLRYNTVSGSVSGSESQVDSYPTGSNQTSSIKVYSPNCDKVYMARLYQFTASKEDGDWNTGYSITDIEDAIDVTHELTGSKWDYKHFNRHFIKLRNDVI